MRRPFSFLLLLVVALVGDAAPTRADDAPSMTLSQAVAFARAHHPRIAASDQEVAASEAEREVPRSRWLPRVGVTAQAIGGSNNNSGAIWLGSRGAVEFPRIAGTGFLQQPSATNWRPYMNTAVGVGFQQEIFDFGRIAAERASADARASAAHARAEGEVLDVVLGVREAFYAVRAGHEVLAAAIEAVRRAGVHRDATCALSERGLRPHADCERVEADVARYRAAVFRAEGALSAARVGLSAAIGSDAPETEVDAADASVETPPPHTLAAATNAAVEHEPELRAADADAEAADANARRAAAELRPQVFALGAVMGAAGGAPTESTPYRQGSTTYGAGAIPWIPDYYVGAVFSWNVFDAPAAARNQALRAEAQASRLRVDALREVVRTRAAGAWVEADAAVRAQPELERALRAAEISYAEIEGRFRAGLATIIELTDVEALRVEAQVSVAVGRFDVARSEARLERALTEDSAP